MHTLDYPVFDADNHYYEALDAFTRHLDPALGPRVIEWAEVNGRRYHSVGGRINHAVTNPTFNPISPAGALFDYFRGNPNGVPMHELMGRPEPIRPEYRDRDARLAVMDAQGIAQVWLFPTLGMLYEEALRDDPEAVVLLFRAFNRWLAEDWGMAYRDRIFAAPYITLVDVDEAVRELEWALDQDARSVVLRAAAPVRRRARARRRRTSSTPSGPGSTRPASPWSSTPETPASPRTATPWTASPPPSSRGRPVRASRCSPLSGRPTTGWPRSSSRSSSTASPTCGWPRSRTAPSSWPALSQAAHHGPPHAGLLSRGPGRHLPAPRLDQSLLGGRRRRDRRPHGRRPRHLRIGLAPHRRACPSRPNGCASSRSCPRSPSPRSWAPTCPS